MKRRVAGESGISPATSVELHNLEKRSGVTGKIILIALRPNANVTVWRILVLIDRKMPKSGLTELSMGFLWSYGTRS